MENSEREVLLKIADLIKKAKGDRTLREYAADAGVSPSNISRIMKAEYKPRPDMIAKLTKGDAKPRGGVTYEEVMVAAGYQDDYMEKTIADWKNELVNAKDDQDENIKEKLRRRREEVKRQEQYFISAVVGNIFQKMGENGRVGAVLNVKSATYNQYRPDVIIGLPWKSPDFEWWLEFRSKFRMQDTKLRGIYLPHLFGNFVICPPTQNRKVSIVVDDLYLFENLCSYKGQLSYRGELSILFFSDETFSIEKEVYLAHYDENNHDSEFLIV